MVRIVLFCNAGMSTSLLINKMLTQAATEGFACTVDAFATANAAEEGKNADVILLGPQVRHELKRIRGLFSRYPCGTNRYDGIWKNGWRSCIKSG